MGTKSHCLTGLSLYNLLQDIFKMVKNYFQFPGSFASKWTTKKVKNFSKFWSQNTNISIHIYKQVFKLSESEFGRILVKNCKNGTAMKLKYTEILSRT